MPSRKHPKFKTCLKCSEDFQVIHGNQKYCSLDCAISGYSLINKERIREQQKQSRNKPEYRLRRKLEHREQCLKRYGVTDKTFEQLRNEQNNQCSICKIIMLEDHIRIDHNHKTLKFRVFYVMNVIQV